MGSFLAGKKFSFLKKANSDIIWKINEKNLNGLNVRNKYWLIIQYRQTHYNKTKYNLQKKMNFQRLFKIKGKIGLF